MIAHIAVVPVVAERGGGRHNQSGGRRGSDIQLNQIGGCGVWDRCCLPRAGGCRRGRWVAVVAVGVLPLVLLSAPGVLLLLWTDARIRRQIRERCCHR